MVVVVVVVVLVVVVVVVVADNANCSEKKLRRKKGERAPAAPLLVSMSVVFGINLKRSDMIKS